MFRNLYKKKTFYLKFFLYHFNIQISKIILKKYYFHVFLNKKYFKKQKLPHFHTLSNSQTHT